jgi:hypothetical protein
MKKSFNLDSVYAPSEDVVAREIEGEIILIPLTVDVGGMEDELFTLNETGKVIWKKLDGEKSLKKIGEELDAEFKAPSGEVRRDIEGFMKELVKRGIVTRVLAGKRLQKK